MGLIPAYAGRTNSMGYEAIVQRAHPRLRGADHYSNDDPTPAEGSSPLTRGGQWRRGRTREYRGLIPAYAGRTRLARAMRVPRGAHPRLRGAD
ncbi:conserved hypothetical protein [Corynebacterium striatum]|nr:conserved hypothetical protein [Corynebacterium striatum]